MNLLAHAYLSFNEPGILAGNMISDYVKGRKKFDLPAQVQAGIALHRDIDSFTDSHPITREMKELFKKDYGLYSAPITDIIYDHLLANDPGTFPKETDLQEFSLHTYASLETYTAWFPPVFEQMFPYMKKYDWLFNYRFNHGMEKSLEGLTRRAKYMGNHARAMEIFLSNKPLLNEYYIAFFPMLKKHAQEVLIKLKNH